VFITTDNDDDLIVYRNDLMMQDASETEKNKMSTQKGEAVK